MKTRPLTPAPRPPGARRNSWLCLLALATGLSAATPSPAQEPLTNTFACDIIPLRGTPSLSAPWARGLSEPVTEGRGGPLVVGQVSSYPVYGPPGPNSAGTLWRFPFGSPTSVPPLESLPTPKYADVLGVTLNTNGTPFAVGFGRLATSFRHACFWPNIGAASVPVDLGTLLENGSGSSAARAVVTLDARCSNQVFAVGESTAKRLNTLGRISRYDATVFWRIGVDTRPIQLTPLLPGRGNAVAYAASVRNKVVGASVGRVGTRESSWATFWPLPPLNNLPFGPGNLNPAPSTLPINLHLNLTRGPLADQTVVSNAAGGIAYAVALAADGLHVVAGVVDLAQRAPGDTRNKNRAAIWVSDPSPTGEPVAFGSWLMPESAPEVDATRGTIVNSIARGVNNSRTVVGDFTWRQGNGRARFRGFVSDVNIHGSRKWRTAVPGDTSTWAEITGIRAINNEGHMIGTARRKNASFETEVFLFPL